ncbi:MAG: hypothetical protein ACPIOQ_72240, partial [Promethearchaeia archaeon]
MPPCSAGGESLPCLHPRAHCCQQHRDMLRSLDACEEFRRACSEFLAARTHVLPGRWGQHEREECSGVVLCAASSLRLTAGGECAQTMFSDVRNLQSLY